MNNAYLSAIQSLKLYRRAELVGAGGNELVEQLYVDPLPGDHVLSTLLSPHTTFLVGRKGSGKSTVFQRAQFELRKRNDVVTSYVDIASVYESTRVDPDIGTLMGKFPGAMSPQQLEALWLDREFFSAIVSSVLTELEKKVKNTFWDRVKTTFSGTSKNLFARLYELQAEASAEKFENVIGAFLSTASTTEETGHSRSAGIAIAPSGMPSASAALDSTAAKTVAVDSAALLMRVFDLRQFIIELRKILNECGVRHLYIFLDDFSELPQNAMKTVVDGLIAPLNNWSEELVKFKVAAYPGMVYLGSIDRGKMDEVNLDMTSLYSSSDSVEMESKAIDFTKRLVLRRFEHFGVVASDVFENNDAIWEQLYNASAGNPRILGYVLYFAYESSLLYSRKIGSGAIRDAAKKYYEEKIQASFEMKKFLSETFDERSSIFSLKELLEAIVDRAKNVRRSESTLFRDLAMSKPPTSHFHIAPDLESLLSTLELNFFVTRYTVMSDRDGRKTVVYALNYGLCQQQNIPYGRPVGTREKRYRQYYVERVFDYSSVLRAYAESNQEIVCDSCGESQSMEALPALRAYAMLCPACRLGTCEVINLSRKYEKTLRAVAEEQLLPAVELGILHTLRGDDSPLRPAEVAGELDVPYQLVGKRAKNLDERGLVKRSYEGNQRVYSPTELARRVYFS